MENKEKRPESVPYIVHESEMARMERVNKRWFIAWLITFLLLIGCVAGFIWYESQYVDEVTETIETSAEGGGNAYGTIVSGWTAEATATVPTVTVDRMTMGAAWPGAEAPTPDATAWAATPVTATAAPVTWPISSAA